MWGRQALAFAGGVLVVSIPTQPQTSAKATKDRRTGAKECRGHSLSSTDSIISQAVAYKLAASDLIPR